MIFSIFINNTSQIQAVSCRIPGNCRRSEPIDALPLRQPVTVGRKYRKLYIKGYAAVFLSNNIVNHNSTVAAIRIKNSIRCIMSIQITTSQRFTILSAHCSLRFILLCLSRILCVLTEHINIVVSFFICMIIDRIVHPIDDQSALWNVVIIVLPVFRLFAVFHYKKL